ncbi:EAL domain-containing protein [Achromobacter sp. GG226]|uniref:putative bifunctional diguanylate cyclase/phosphodiesterase n=1 Tax=Verticiella alkaliphila TaxID=2779529 RepID=UPI001C0D56D2|nr:EAL domain-containing protein [Verticiella sp. GG226]MBU4611374.1 EAL domain-containing protein [Verticiella sp. GG226]
MTSSVRAFEHATGVLEGGLLTLAALTLMTALITRESRYVLFAVWLLGNLRLGGISMGFDTQWLTRSIPPGWMDSVRQLTIAIYYIVTYTLFGQFLRTELSRVGYAWLFRFASRAGLVLLVLALVLDFSTFLPAMWVIVSFSIVVVTFFLARIAIVTRSRIAVWYAVALVIVFVSTLSEVIAAAFGFKLVIGALNSVTAALAASLVAAFAFAEQIRLERQERLDAQAELHRTYETAPVGLFTLDAEGRFVRCNAALQRLLDLHPGPQEERWGTYFEPGAWARLREIVRHGGEAEIRGAPRPDGSARWYLVRGAQAHHSHIEGSLQDITERREATDRLRFIAHNDSLTGVLNRRGIESKLDAVIRHADREAPLALAYLDLDRFKLINDLYGHQAGDEVLKQVCERVQGLLGPGQHMGRVGGDEFILVLRRTSMAEAAALARRVFDVVGDSPYRLRRRAFQVRTSIGLIEIAADMRAQDAISAADRACREAKRGTHGHVVTYEKDDPAFQARIEELRLIEALGSTFSPAGLMLMMQPIMSLQSPEASLNFEVLLRMREPDGTILPAGRVIAAAEANGTIGELDKWVLESTLTWLLQHGANLPNTHFVCVNLSGASINDESFMADTYRILERYPSVVRFLCIEITESVALHDIDNSRRFIEQLQRLGARIALDDFGAGYTSFSYLKEFSAHALKIDGAFIQSMQAHPANAAILEAIVELARNLGMRSIAEWVEDYDTLSALAALGVDYVQGFIIAPPMSPDRLLTGTSAASFITDARVLAFVQARREGRAHESPGGYLH